LIFTQEGRAIMQRGMNVLALVKDSERYVFLYDDESPEALLQQLGRFAADESLSFTWYDAAILSQRVRRLRKEVERNSRLGVSDT
jgi:hypothetical protein